MTWQARWLDRLITLRPTPVVAQVMALVLVGLATVARLALDSFGSGVVPFATYYPVVLIVTLAGGALAGCTAWAAGVLSVWFFIFPERNTFSPLTAMETTNLLLFSVTNVLIIVVAHRLRETMVRLRADEARLRATIESLPYPLMLHAEDGTVLALSDRWSTQTGYFRDELRTVQDWTRRAHPDQYAEVDRRIARSFEMARTSSPREYLVRTRFGDRIWEFTSVPVDTLANGRRLRLSAAIDITERKRAEDALRESEGRFRALVEATPQLVWATRADGMCDYMNRQWADFSGLPMERLLGQEWLNIVHPDDRPRVVGRWSDTVADRSIYDAEFRMRDRHGEYRWFKTRAWPLPDDEGRVLRWIGTCTDFTEILEAREALTVHRDDLERLVGERTRALEETNRRLLAEIAERERAEAALARAQRLEAIGQLTGGVAHDFNNLLTVIVGNLDMIGRVPDAPDRVRRLARAALAAAERGERLTRQLLAFARRQALRPEVADVNRLVHEEEALVRRAVGEAVEVTFDLDADLGPCRFDVAQFEAALLNLVVNARDATPAGGRITIATRNVVLTRAGNAQEPPCGAPSDLPPGAYVVMAVRDTGTGIPPDVLPRVFEPFFTTKDVGKGSGLGLSQVYGFVRQSGGQVRVDSGVGQGTVVEIWLPRSAEPLGASEPVPEVDGLPLEGAGESVLVVEDDADVRAMAVETLQGLGYRVLVAADGVEAQEVLETADVIDLLFTDMVMPRGIGGADLARIARARRPDLRVLLTSGYMARPLAGEQAATLDFPLLHKPYRGDDLARAVRAALAQPVPPSAAPPTSPPAPSPARTRPARLRVLVVEDDALVRMSCIDMLTDLDIDVIGEAENAEEALGLFDTQDGFDVLLTDMRLPGMDGLSLAAEARRRRPDLKVVLATGYGEDVERPDGMGTDLLILPKPYGSAELSRVLEQARWEPVE